MDKRIIPLKPCEQCWETFEPKKTSQQKFCSNKCRLAHWNEKAGKKREQAIIEGESNTYLKLRFMVLRRDNFTCQYCGRTVKDGVKLHIDHIFPKSKGGDLSIGNLVTACFDCNEGKRDVVLTEREIKKLKQRCPQLQSDATEHVGAF